MPRLELNDEEARELAQALEAQVHELRVELARADIREFKADVRARLELLERVAARLPGAREPGR